MLNLKSDPGLNYLLKFQDFLCTVRRERHSQPCKHTAEWRAASEEGTHHQSSQWP